MKSADFYVPAYEVVVGGRRLDVSADVISLQYTDKVTELDTALLAVEHRRGQCHVTVGGKTVAHRADVAVDTENLLDHHDTAFRRAHALGVGAVSGEPMSIGSS